MTDSPFVANPHIQMFVDMGLRCSAANPHLQMRVSAESSRAAATDVKPTAEGKPCAGEAFAPLTKQELVDKLDNIPAFHLMNDKLQIFPVPNEAGEIAVRWFVDVDEASSALVAVQLLNPDTPLQLGVTPLGTAYALANGWAPNQSTFPLKLMPSKAVVAALAQELGAEPDESAFPLFTCDEMTSARLRPFWTSAEDVRATWLSAGRKAETFPSNLHVVDLSRIVKLALTANGFDGRTLMLIASSKATAKAQQLQELAQSRERELEAAGLGDEPPPLEGEEPPPLE